MHPVHLQASDTYREHLRARAFRRILPDAYGIVESEWDETALARGELIFRKLVVVFASGFEARIDYDDEPLEADIQTRLYGLTTSIAVFVGVPKLVADGTNTTPAGKGARSTRYLGAFDTDTSWMRPKLEILFDDYARDRYDSSEVLAIGRIERAGDVLRFAPTAWPTVLHASASAPLVAAIKEVIETLGRRRRELLDGRKVQPFHLTSATFPQDALDLLALVGRELAMLRALAARRTTPPYRFYEHLQELYLSLASFEEELEQPPLYRHEELGAVLPWFTSRVRDLVDRVVREKAAWLHFKRTAGRYSLSFRREDLPNWKRPILVAHCPEDQRFLGRLPAEIKMAGPRTIEICMQSAAHAVRVKIDDDPPAEIPPGRGIVAYTIVRRDDRHEGSRTYWNEILESKEIHVYLPHAPPTLQLYLYCVDRES